MLVGTSGVSRKGRASMETSLEQAADNAGFSAWAPSLAFFRIPFFLPSAPRPGRTLPCLHLLASNVRGLAPPLEALGKSGDCSAPVITYSLGHAS